MFTKRIRIFHPKSGHHHFPRIRKRKRTQILFHHSFACFFLLLLLMLISFFIYSNLAQLTNICNLPDFNPESWTTHPKIFFFPPIQGLISVYLSLFFGRLFAYLVKTNKKWINFQLNLNKTQFWSLKVTLIYNPIYWLKRGVSFE